MKKQDRPIGEGFLTVTEREQMIKGAKSDVR